MSAAGDKRRKPASDEPPRINLRIKGLEDGNLLMFKTEKRTTLRKLMTAYSDWVSVDVNHNRFFFDGREISAEDTPDALGMVDEDEIFALHCQCGATNAPHSPPLATHYGNMKSEADESPKIILNIQGVDGRELPFRIKKDSPLIRLMKAYCDRKSYDFAGTSFLFGGRRIHPHQTANEWRMEDGDVIDAIFPSAVS